MPERRRQHGFLDGSRAETPPHEACLHKAIEAVARSFPTAPAILFNGESVSYDELNRRANQMVGSLRQRGIGEGSIVALYLPRSPGLIAAQLAVLKAGGACLPLDRTYPVERNRFMVADACPALVITLGELVGELNPSAPVLLLDADAQRITEPGGDDVSASRPDATAYVNYTSGSTGRPKGVLTTHRGQANFIAHMIAARKLKQGERVLRFTSVSFDAAIRDTIGTLSFGGTIILLDDRSASDPRALLAAIRDQRANLILSIVPTMLRALAHAALEERFINASLRLIMVGGETLSRADVEKTRQAFGRDLQIVNQYGATECSMVAADHVVPGELPADTTSIPVGKPILNGRIYILDRDLEPVRPGAEGDLYIGGAGVGRGYLNQPELTAERFLPDPHAGVPDARMYRTGDRARHLEDGSIRYLGRTDHQVKIRGNRVELGEIESVLREHPAVRESAVQAWAGSVPERLVAYVALNGDVQAGDLRSFLASRLPAYMLPDSFEILDDIPLTPNRKVDRMRLPAPRADRTIRTPVPARSTIEQRLVRLWESILGIEQIGVTEDFFDLGGDSLRAVVLLERVKQEFGRELALPVLLQNGTIEALAKLLESGAGADQPGVVPLQQEGDRAPLFLILAHPYLREFALGFAPHRPVYGLQTETPPARSIREEARVLLGNLIEFDPEGPFLLAGHSAGGYLALELAHLLVQDGKRVQFLGLIDTFPPGRRRQASPMERLRIHADNLRGRSVREVMGYLFQAAGRLALRLFRYVPASGHFLAILPMAREKGWVERLVIQKYSPPRYHGDVTLFVAGERPWYVRWDPMARWSQYLAGRLETVRVAGDHMSAMRHPRAVLLAQKMEGLLP